MEHDVIPPAERHGAYNWEVANAAARGAIHPLISDIGKKLWQKDKNLEFVVTDADTFVPTSVVTESLSVAPANPGSGYIYLTKIMYPDGQTLVTMTGNINLSIASAGHVAANFPTGWAPVSGSAKFPLFRNDDGSNIASLSAGTDFWIEVTSANILRIRNATGGGGVSFSGTWQRIFPV